MLTRRRTEFGNEEAPSMTELRIIFDRAVEHLNSVGGDPECLMLKYYANAEAELQEYDQCKEDLGRHPLSPI